MFPPIHSNWKFKERKQAHVLLMRVLELKVTWLLDSWNCWRIKKRHVQCSDYNTYGPYKQNSPNFNSWPSSVERNYYYCGSWVAESWQFTVFDKHQLTALVHCKKIISQHCRETAHSISSNPLLLFLVTLTPSFRKTTLHYWLSIPVWISRSEFSLWHKHWIPLLWNPSPLLLQTHTGQSVLSLSEA